MRLGAVAARLDVVAGGKHRAVEPVKLVVEPLGHPRQDDRHGSGHHERPLVADGGVVAEPVEAR
jgi:hypothetical protein